MVITVEALDFLGYTSDLFVIKSDFRLVGLEASIVESVVQSYILVNSVGCAMTRYSLQC